MRTMKLLSLLLTLSSALPSLAALKVHEWGTFTSMVGSDGITQNGMHHEDEQLPDFVHSFGVQFPQIVETPRPTPTPLPDENCPRPSKMCFGPGILENNVISQKMETPVLYFYTDQSMVVNVNVRFPQGVITQTFPAPVLTSPTQSTLQKIENGSTSFRILTRPTKVALPAVPSGNIYAHARDVASDLIRSLGNSPLVEDEKFIFYRGLGRFQPKIHITSTGDNLSVFVPSARIRPQAAFLTYVNEVGSVAFQELQFEIGQNEIKSAVLNSIKESARLNNTQVARKLLVSRLVLAGLNKDEAVAMYNTWEHGYLRVPGLRLLYILPEQEVEEILPLTISPQPQEIRRAFVARIEILTASEEQKILREILSKQDAFDVASLGRFAEPKLRRIRQVLAQENPTDVQNATLMNRMVERAKNGEGGVLN